MAKRVSMKGKGADLFFDGLDPAATTLPAVVVLSDADQLDTLNERDSTKGLSAATDAPELTAAVPASPAPTPPKTRPRRANDRASTVASTLASELASESPSVSPHVVDPTVVEAIRKIVKHPGKEVSFVRLSPEEKGKLADIVYTYKRQGMKTTENEINRIAVNYLLADYYSTGERSILAQVIAALRA